MWAKQHLQIVRERGMDGSGNVGERKREGAWRGGGNLVGGKEGVNINKKKE